MTEADTNVLSTKLVQVKLDQGVNGIFDRRQVNESHSFVRGKHLHTFHLEATFFTFEELLEGRKRKQT
jgi:hypothetical protein